MASRIGPNSAAPSAGVSVPVAPQNQTETAPTAAPAQKQTVGMSQKDTFTPVATPNFKMDVLD